MPVWALDAEVVDAGGLGIRTTVAATGSGPTRTRATCTRARWWSPTPSASTRCCSARSRRVTASAPRHERDRPVRGRRRGRSGDPRRGGAVGLRRGPGGEAEGAVDPSGSKTGSVGRFDGKLASAQERRESWSSSSRSSALRRSRFRRHRRPTRRRERAARRSDACADRAARARACRRVRDRVSDGRPRASARLSGDAAAARPRRARAGARRARRAAARCAGRRSPSARRSRPPTACCSSGCCSSPASYRFARISRARHRRARLRRLAGPAAPRPDRDADGLVAGQALLRLSVSRGRGVAPRP